MPLDAHAIERRRAIERRVQTALLTGLVLLIGWLARTTVEVDKRTAVIDERLANMEIDRARESSRARNEVATQMRTIEQRIAETERQLAAIREHAPWQ